MVCFYLYLCLLYTQHGAELSLFSPTPAPGHSSLSLFVLSRFHWWESGIKSMAMIHSAPLFLIHILSLALLPLKITTSPTTEAEALIKWKNSLISSSPLNSSWSLTNIGNLCNWTGIACHSTGSISVINLSETQLEGTLAQFDFGSFPNLTGLNLSTNSKLNGSTLLQK